MKELLAARMPILAARAARRFASAAARASSSFACRAVLLPHSQNRVGPHNSVRCMSSALRLPTDDSCILPAHGPAADLLGAEALVVTREIEWANVFIGYEQANRYSVRAADGQVVAYIAEETSFGKSVLRNITSTHRAFTAHVLDPDGNKLFAVKRPFYFIASNMFVENHLGQTIGEIKQKWHPFRRRYNLYRDVRGTMRQFAAVDAPVLSPEFRMVDEQGALLAAVDKNFTGWARELFTDGRQYIVYLCPTSEGVTADYTPFFGSAGGAARRAFFPETAQGSAQGGGSMEEVKTDVVLPSRPITVDERALTLACAISIDFDYYSLHSHSGIG